MRIASMLGAAAVGAATLAIAIAQALAQSPGTPLGAEEITGALNGVLCTSRVGAKFTFTDDGHYAYEGLWKNEGHYSVGNGAITVVLDSGLERSFAITRREGMLYMEQVAIACTPLTGPLATATTTR